MSDESTVKTRLAAIVGAVVQAQSDAIAALPGALDELDRQHALERADIAAKRAALQAQLAELEQRLVPLGNAAWDNPGWAQWAPPPLGSEPPRTVRIGEFSERAGEIEEWFPALVPLIGSGSLCIIAPDAQKQEALAVLQSVTLRLLAGIPAGMLRLTVIDSLGQGNNASNFVALGEYDENLVTKAATEPNRIEQQLADLTAHIENVLQSYLKADFATIEDYNLSGGVRVAGSATPASTDEVNPLAEPYRVVVVFDFPNNFSDIAARRLVSLVQNGARCGVYALIHLDPGRKLPHGFNAAEITSHCQVITQRAAGVFLSDSEPDAQRNLERCAITLDAVRADVARRIVHEIGTSAKSAQGISVPFERISPSPESWWRGADIDGKLHGTELGLRVAVGPRGKKAFQYLDIGRDSTKNHVLVAGRSGSGKSKLLHAIIINLALTYSPEEAELYLLDFKEGIEFRIYADPQTPLPHASVVAIESEREYGLSVLKKLQGIIKERGEQFAHASYQSNQITNLGGYRSATNKPMTRILVVIDEFQVLFNDNDAIAAEAARIIDDLARRGRSFGIHLLLATQTLTGSGRLPDSTLAQFGVRIALMCNDADSRRILADDNGAARLLRRAGEAYYNDMNGMVEGNSRFQVALLRDEQLKKYVDALHQRSKSRTKQIVFEGSRPAQLENNELLQQVCGKLPETKPPRRILAWLGEPIALEDPTAALFRRQRGSNLIIAGRNEALAFGMLTCSIVSIAAQFDHAAATFTIADFSDVDDERFSPYLQRLADVVPQRVTYTRPRGLAASLQRLADELAERETKSEQGLSTRPSMFLVIFGLHRARDLQPDSIESTRPVQSNSAPVATEARRRPRLSDDNPTARDASQYGDSIDSGNRHDARSNPAPTMPQVPPAQLFPRLLRQGSEMGIHTIVWCDSYNSIQSIGRNILNEFDTRVALQMSDKDGYSLLNTSGAEKLTNVRALLVNQNDGRTVKFRPYSEPDVEWVKQILDMRDRVNSL